jgi:hypothetical protein
MPNSRNAEEKAPSRKYLSAPSDEPPKYSGGKGCW